MYLRYTSSRSDKVYHLYYYSDKVVVEYGPFGRALREIVYPGDKGLDKEQEKRKKGYEDYQPSPPMRFSSPHAPAPKKRPEKKTGPEETPGLTGKLETEPIEGESPMIGYLF